MTLLEKWLLKHIIRREVLQGFNHGARIAGLYELIREACENEFTEDNAATLNAFLAECFERTQRNALSAADANKGKENG